MYTVFALSVIASYLLGSIPFGLIIAKAHGKDLRSIGSGNIGATNVSRALGKKWAYLCFVLDVLKGAVPTLAASNLIFAQNNAAELFLSLTVGTAAIVGHIFPIYSGFKGGKGVATSFGVAIGFWPYYTVCAIAAILIWSVVVLIWHYISLGSIVAALTFPMILLLAITLIEPWHFSYLWPLCIVALCMPVMVVFRHKENIKRIFAGTESKIFRKGSS